MRSKRPTSLASSPSERGLAGVRLSFKGLSGVGSAMPSDEPEPMSDWRCTGELSVPLLLDLLKALSSPIFQCQCMSVTSCVPLSTLRECGMVRTSSD